MLSLLWRNAKWRLQYPISIFLTLLQPLLWLVLYSAVAAQAIQGAGISNYTAFILPGISVLCVFAACSSGGMVNFLSKDNGSFNRLLIAPISRPAIVLGQVLEAVLLSLFEVGVLLATAVVFFAVPLPHGWITWLCMLGLLAVTAFLLATLTYTLSLLLPNAVLYETVMTALILPFFFLSSALFPPDGLSGTLAMVVTYNPFSQVIDALRALLFAGPAAAVHVWPVLLAFSLLGLGGFSLAVWRLAEETAQ